MPAKMFAIMIVVKMIKLYFDLRLDAPHSGMIRFLFEKFRSKF